ncbi:hypothetical protein LEP1GSC199_3761 [Leptospira vanthielii serovar Holland str. Waz Holland = ATCC 700522]|uniref:Uncharacterized protein n=1 Tax=Leptospira vanthielii serovar Holland str. Waz Holland = ATCC 700522 TaxID=1218591 RepID=N1W440_9LEPT|nr:hypothetical protein LEP1GSC199_3761 [Leptospira vanthielii serovar Holland str. Waz Holland = ATCC 700522]
MEKPADIDFLSEPLIKCQGIFLLKSKSCLLYLFSILIAIQLL